MKREYTAGEFRKVVDTLIELVPGMQIATDIICGFPGETDEDFEETINLIKDYKLPQVHISQFYPRPGALPTSIRPNSIEENGEIRVFLQCLGTPAARMKKVPSNIVKKRSRELTTVFESFTPYVGMEGKIERIWITDIATDGTHLVGHTKGYIQVLVVGPESMLGTSAMVKITSVARWSVFGEVLEILTENFIPHVNQDEKISTCSDEDDTCSKESETCACGVVTSSCCGQTDVQTVPFTEDEKDPSNARSQDLIGWLLGKRKNSSSRTNENEVLELDEKPRTRDEWALVDKVLLFGILLSFFTIVSIMLYLGYRDMRDLV